MHITIQPKTFHEITVDTDVQNLSTELNIFYVENATEPTLVNGYLTDGHILVPFENVKFVKDVENGYLYNPNNISVEVQA